MTEIDRTGEVRQRLEARLEQATATIRRLSIGMALMFGVIGAQSAYIIAGHLHAPPLGAVGSAGATFIAVSTLALVVGAVNPSGVVHAAGATEDSSW
ncbi:hypothetical protein [Streptomyces lunaelactis]|uniref:hypothetical protein n=1 Tax=Streptomyces lunaelactis TaxID=1535768 RepID=UPI00131ED34F|nr:hypothetical protein [Streptomyces lunaelactis]NUK84547.1 hypothetical protein [Streptomyces lunaelactis]